MFAQGDGIKEQLPGTQSLLPAKSQHFWPDEQLLSELQVQSLLSSLQPGMVKPIQRPAPPEQSLLALQSSILILPGMGQLASVGVPPSPVDSGVSSPPQISSTQGSPPKQSAFCVHFRFFEVSIVWKQPDAGPMTTQETSNKSAYLTKLRLIIAFGSIYGPVKLALLARLCLGVVLVELLEECLPDVGEDFAVFVDDAHSQLKRDTIA